MPNMRHYLPLAEAAAYLDTGEVIEFPHLDENTEAYPLFDPPITDPFEGEPVNPSKLVREILHHVGEEPKRVLDLGAGFSGTGLYLAAHGHDVTVIDAPEPIDWQNGWAQQLGLQANFRGYVGDARMLQGSDKYDLIIAEMLLHFLDEADSRRLLTAMRTATLIGGFNIVSVYTDDNPPLEKRPPRNLQQLFAPGSLLKFYNSAEWETIRHVEGLSDRYVPREHLGKAWC